MGLLISMTAAGAAVMVVYKLCCGKPPALPVLDLEQYWGPGSAVEGDKSLRPFSVVFSDDMIKDLKERLSKHRKLTPPLEGVGFEYGFNTDYLSTVVAFWKDQYAFKVQEKFLNKFPQFVTKVQGLDVHFLHVKPDQTSSSLRVLPLLLLHGWPGSVREFYEMIPLLTTPRPGRDFVFDVIVPSLPGYGFSQAASKPGLGTMEVAIVMRNLMRRLGFSKFIIQGGDWGSIIGSHIATLFPDEVCGYHTNFAMVRSMSNNLKWLLGAVFPSLVVEARYADRIYPIKEKFVNQCVESGYLLLQATKPDTVGVALNDSPIGLAAYILEKFSTWTNDNYKKAQDGKLTERFTLTDLLDNLMIYWVTNSITSSMRLYSESINARYLVQSIDSIPTKVPTAIICFKYENYRPTSFYKEKYPNLVQHTVLDHTGHFAALESPESLADDLWDATDNFILFHKKK